MGKQTIFRKVSPENNWNEDSVVIGCYGGDILTLTCTRYGDRDHILGFIDLQDNRYSLYEIDWVLKEIEFPTKEDIRERLEGGI